VRADHLTIEELSAYVDNALAADERESSDAHLRDCAACQHELAELQQAVTLLRAVPNRAAPRSFHVSAQAAVTPAMPVRPEAPRRRAPIISPVWLRGLSGVAAAFMVVAFASDLLGSLASKSTAVPTAGQYQSAPAERPAASSADQAAPQLRSQPARGDGGSAEGRSAAAAPTPAANVTEAGGGSPPASAPQAAPPIAGAAAPSAPAADSGASLPRVPAVAPAPAQEAARQALQPTPTQSSASSNVSAASRGVSEPAAPPPESPHPWLTLGQTAGLALGLLALALLCASFLVGRTVLTGTTDEHR
jgi:anti-sigma factor RsiW